MAAHDYYSHSGNGDSNSPPSYHNHNNASPYHDYSERNEAPLPPIPQPPQSPFGDRVHPCAHQSPQQSYAGSSGRIHHDADPFDDGNAIPLNGRNPKHDSTHTVSPILPHEQDDPFVRDADPRRKRRRDHAPAPVQEQGWFKGKITWVVFVLTFVQLVVFIAEIIRNGVLTGSPIEIKPSFNPMIGPSPYVLINMGARYQPCMHTMPNVQNSSVPISWPCPNATATTGDSTTCQLSDLCNMSSDRNPRVGGSLDDTPAPDQWWRFIVPIFLHAGIIHIGFNMLLQLTLGRDVELLIGSIRFAILYFASGIFGFILGGNFAATGIASTGASGSLFGILAITLLDLLYTWKERRSPIKDFLFIVIDILIAFVLGLLPGLDNFSHIGGFLMGLVLGLCLLRSPTAIGRRTSTVVDPVYTHVAHQNERDASLKTFIKDPVGHFKARRVIWWAWWVVRAVALVGVLIGFILLLKNFYEWRNGCSWCKYLSCLPIKVGGTDWCNVGNLDFTSTTTNSTSKRSLVELTRDVFEVAELL
ncbi:Putative peptidase S54, rhomboid, Rhomboid-like superfamily [Septoria linicola]|uniref:Rhomboid-type serine protease n=1 Tax=Septoria linicola TaxID=215465 RepID=A0A9Q9ARY3_9PEZI|nr:Putative peptidase S54, rhomboid, Rhomboid-like superfamily [Septoria linicola]